RAWSSTYALVVISPAMTTRPVAVKVSQATRLMGSSARQASRIASETWSAILSGWPSVTDSDVKRYRFFAATCFSLEIIRQSGHQVGGAVRMHALHECFRPIK